MGADPNLKRKIGCNQKAFTSQIDGLPGPKSHLIKHAGEGYKAEADDAYKRAD
jgi:hypothetical protein